MDVESDFSDVEKYFEDGKWEVQKAMIDVGDAAVKDSEENGTYQDHTLTLRTSNAFDVDEDGLALQNTTEYASYVEAKGFEVLSGAALRAEKKLREMTR